MEKAWACLRDFGFKTMHPQLKGRDGTVKISPNRHRKRDNKLLNYWVVFLKGTHEKPTGGGGRTGKGGAGDPRSCLSPPKKRHTKSTAKNIREWRRPNKIRGKGRAESKKEEKEKRRKEKKQKKEKEQPYIAERDQDYHSSWIGKGGGGEKLKEKREGKRTNLGLK